MWWGISKLTGVSATIFNWNLITLLAQFRLVLQRLVYHSQLLGLLLHAWHFTVVDAVVSWVLHHSVNILCDLRSTRASCSFHAFDGPIHHHLSLILALVVVYDLWKIERMFFFLSWYNELSPCNMWWDCVQIRRVPQNASNWFFWCWIQRILLYNWLHLVFRLDLSNILKYD